MKQQIKGGKGDKLNPKDLDQTQLQMGIKVEMEHTKDPKLAKEIAIDHLSEDPKYYTKLKSAKLEHKMNKSKIIKLIENVVVQEMARIATLLQLSTTDDNEIDAKMPADLQKSGIVKQIINYFKNNGNTPTAVIDMAKSFGYAAQQPINTQIQRLRSAGILVDKGLKTPKQVKEPLTNRLQYQQDVFDTSPDISKIEYIIKHQKQDLKIPQIFVDWFKEKHGEDKYQELENLTNQWKSAGGKQGKESLIGIKKQLKDFVIELGYKVKPSDETPKITRSKPDDQGFEKVSYSKENPKLEEPPVDDEMDDEEDEKDEFGGVYERKNQPAPSRPSTQPGIKEPPAVQPGKAPKRRTLTPPDPDAKPTPKNEISVNHPILIPGKKYKLTIFGVMATGYTGIAKYLGKEGKYHKFEKENGGKIGWSWSDDRLKDLIQKQKISSLNTNESQTVKKPLDYTKAVASSAKDYADKNQNENKGMLKKIVDKYTKLKKS